MLPAQTVGDGIAAILIDVAGLAEDDDSWSLIWKIEKPRIITTSMAIVVRIT
jgi:hypothetical protein